MLPAVAVTVRLLEENIAQRIAGDIARLAPASLGTNGMAEARQ